MNGTNHALYLLLSRLETARIQFTLARYRPDTILVSVTVPGERIEIEVFADGHMEISRFGGAEDIVGDASLALAIIEQYRD